MSEKKLTPAQRQVLGLITDPTARNHLGGRLGVINRLREKGLVAGYIYSASGDHLRLTDKGIQALGGTDLGAAAIREQVAKMEPTKAYVFIGRPWDTEVRLWTLDGLPIEGIEDQVAEAVEDYIESEGRDTVQAWIGFQVEIETKTVLKPDAMFDKIKELFT